MKRLISVARRLIGDLHSHSFVRLAQVAALSSAGDALIAVALAGSVFFNEDPNTARGRVALSLLLTMAPFAVVAPFLGPAIDRARGGRRLILLVAASSRALLCLIMATSLNSVALYPIVFFALVFSKTHAVAKSASVPEIIRDERSLVKANSVLAVSAVMASFFSAAIGFLISQVGGNEWVLRFAALIFAAGAALALEVGTENAHPSHGKARETAEQLRDTGVLLAAVVMGVLRMAVGFLAFLVAFELRRANAPTWWFGIAISAGLFGSSLGSLVGPKIRRHVREEYMLIASAIIVCAAAVGAAQIDTRATAALVSFVLGACAAAGKLGFDSLVQRDAPSAVQGRSFARFEAAFQLVWVFGALVPVTLTVSVQVGYYLLAIACGTAAIWYLLSPRAAQPAKSAGR